MTDAQDFARLFADYQATYGNELRAKVARLDGLVGRKHWLSVGTYKENIIRSILADRLPTQYEIGSGFVMAQQDGQRLLSKQIDLLVWDSHSHSPFFRDGDFVIVAPEAIAAAIEVKSSLTPKTLLEALINLDSLMVFEKFFRQEQVIQRSVFAFGCKKGFPYKMFDYLNRYYVEVSSIPLNERLEMIVNYDRWSLPWIDNIAALDRGVINCQRWDINGQPAIAYASYRATSKGGGIDAYGLLERSLLLSPSQTMGCYIGGHETSRKSCCIGEAPT